MQIATRYVVSQCCIIVGQSRIQCEVSLRFNAIVQPNFRGGIPSWHLPSDEKRVAFWDPPSGSRNSDSDSLKQIKPSLQTSVLRTLLPNGREGCKWSTNSHMTDTDRTLTNFRVQTHGGSPTEFLGRRCSQVTLVSDNIRFIRIFVGSLKRRHQVTVQWSKTSIFSANVIFSEP